MCFARPSCLARASAAIVSASGMFWVRPVNKKQVDMVEAEPLQAVFGRSPQIVGGEIRPPHLGGHEEFVARTVRPREFPCPTSASLPYMLAVSM